MEIRSNNAMIDEANLRRYMAVLGYDQHADLSHLTNRQLRDLSWELFYEVAGLNPAPAPSQTE